MDPVNKFISKSILSFKSKNFYQAVREFNSGLLRNIEISSYLEIEGYFNLIFPFLESNSLNHETQQIIQSYLVHLKKHKDIKKGIIPIFNILEANLASNSFPNSTLALFYGVTEFTSNVQEFELIEYFKKHYIDFLSFSSFQYISKIKITLFSLLIVLSQFSEAENIGRSLFLKEQNSVDNIEFALFTILIIAINGKMNQSVEILQDLKKKTPIKIQKDSKIFQCCSEFILASSTKDFNWIKELESFYSDVLKDKVSKILIMNLIKFTFPEETKVSIFDIFK